MTEDEEGFGSEECCCNRVPCSKLESYKRRRRKGGKTCACHHDALDTSAKRFLPRSSCMSTVVWLGTAFFCRSDVGLVGVSASATTGTPATLPPRSETDNAAKQIPSSRERSQSWFVDGVSGGGGGASSDDEDEIESSEYEETWPALPLETTVATRNDGKEDKLSEVPHEGQDQHRDQKNQEQNTQNQPSIPQRIESVPNNSDRTRSESSNASDSHSSLSRQQQSQRDETTPNSSQKIPSKLSVVHQSSPRSHSTPQHRYQRPSTQPPITTRGPDITAKPPQPLKTLEKLQQMLDETDYMTTSASASAQKILQEWETTDQDNEHSDTDDNSMNSMDSDDTFSRESTDRLWTSKDRSKYKKQQRKAQMLASLASASPPIQQSSVHSEDEASDDFDDGLGYTLPNLPVYFSDAETDLETDLSETDQGGSSAAATSSMGYLANNNNRPQQVPTPHVSAYPPPMHSYPTNNGQIQQQPQNNNLYPQYQSSPFTPPETYGQRPPPPPQQQQQQQQQQHQQQQQLQLSAPYNMMYAPPNAQHGYAAHHTQAHPQQQPPNPYAIPSYPYGQYNTHQHQQMLASHYAAWAASVGYNSAPPPQYTGPQRPYPYTQSPPSSVAAQQRNIIGNPSTRDPQQLQPPPQQQQQQQQQSRSGTVKDNNSNDPAAKTDVGTKVGTAAPIPDISSAAQGNTGTTQTTAVAATQAAPMYHHPASVIAPNAQYPMAMYLPPSQFAYTVENPSTFAEASSKINFDSIQKISLILVAVALTCYSAVSPRTLPLTEYNRQFYDNMRLVSLATIAPIINFLSIFDAHENDVNDIVSALCTSFTVGYIFTFLIEIVLTTFIRLGVFYFLEPKMFELLTPTVPVLVLPWVLRENSYKPKRITLFATDFITSCVVCPIVEEYIKLQILLWTVKLPKNFNWVTRKSTKSKKKRKVAEAIVTTNGEPRKEVTSINKYVTHMLAVSLGLKLSDAVRRICMYTKAHHANKSFYAICRGIFPIHELCGTVSALSLAKRDVLGWDMPLWAIVLPSAVIHGMANFRGMKPVFKWNSATPWSEMQLSAWNVDDDSTLPQLLSKGFGKLMWVIILGRVLGYCIKNYYLINRQAVKRTTTYAGKHSAFSAEVAATEMLKKTKEDR